MNTPNFHGCWFDPGGPWTDPESVDSLFNECMNHSVSRHAYLATEIRRTTGEPFRKIMDYLKKDETGR